LGAFSSYLLAAIAIIDKSIFLFLLSRVMAGLTAGSQPIAQAAIIDISDTHRKAHNLSFMILAISLGYACGPLISGFFSNQYFFSWFNLATPLFLAAVLSFTNILLLIFSFNVIYKTAETSKIENLNLLKGVIDLVVAFKDNKLRSLAWIYFILQLGWGFYFQFISLFLVKKILFSATEVGIFMALIAIGFAITSLFLIRWIMKFFSIVNATSVALIIASIVFLITCLIDKYNFFIWAIPLFVGINIGVAYTFLITLFSNRVDSHEQGKVMGIATSISAITWVFSSFLGGLLINFNISIPLFVSTILLFIGAIFAFIYSYYHEQNRLQINELHDYGQ
jgi:predicted MFS family arabinose efflux permease